MCDSKSQFTPPRALMSIAIIESTQFFLLCSVSQSFSSSLVHVWTLFFAIQLSFEFHFHTQFTTMNSIYWLVDDFVQRWKATIGWLTFMNESSKTIREELVQIYCLAIFSWHLISQLFFSGIEFWVVKWLKLRFSRSHPHARVYSHQHGREYSLNALGAHSRRVDTVPTTQNVNANSEKKKSKL